DRRHLAVAEFLVKDAVASSEGRDRAGGFRHQLALDGDGAAAQGAAPAATALRMRGRVFVEAAPPPTAALGTLPAGGGVIRAERGRIVEARGAVAAHPAALRFGHLDMRLRQLVEEARRPGGRPRAADA